MEGTVNKAAGLVFLLCRCGDRDFHVYLSDKKSHYVILIIKINRQPL